MSGNSETRNSKLETRFPLVTCHVPAHSAAQSRSSRLCAALLFVFLVTLHPALVTVRAANMRFGPYTNYDGTLITNTTLLVRPIGDPAIDAAGNVTAAIGLPTRIALGSDGMATNTLQNQNYFVTNALGGTNTRLVFAHRRPNILRLSRIWVKK